MEVTTSISITLEHSSLHSSVHCTNFMGDTSTPESRRAFMQHTIDALQKVKETSDMVLTGLIEAAKQ
jgi:hypothetical protein